jgi:hypothetical protein
LRSSTRTISEKARATITRPGSATSGMSPNPHSSMSERSRDINCPSDGISAPCGSGRGRIRPESRRRHRARPAEAARLRTQSAAFQRPLIGVGVLDLAADMEADADLEAGACSRCSSSTACAGPAPNFFDSS